MLIDLEGQVSNETSTPKTEFVEKEKLHDPPPSYSSQPGSNAASGSEHLVTPATFKTKPTNFLALSNESNSIKGEFVIDPSLRIPPSLLPPLPDGKTEADRKNLRLHCKCASVNAEVWLLGSPRSDTVLEEQERTTIDLSSDHGSINAQVKTIHEAAPFLLTACAPHGSVRISLPRSFQGFLSLSTQHGSIYLADAISQNATQLSQLDTARRYFVGDFSLLGDSEWTGDELRIEAKHDSIRIKYVDDAVDEQSHGRLLYSAIPEMIPLGAVRVGM
ncbi:hypothetical protein BU15DRAFT_74044 [Melanogaster broomeanus]|nr:hypothetical protein BU15DRAFT_74044 [Melanogaster broomeanus]